MQTPPQSSIDLPGIKKLRSGKVREVFDLGDTLLFVVTDRISAFDVILPDPIPHKGAVLNQISTFWFKRFDTIQNHLVTAKFEEFPKELQQFRESDGTDGRFGNVLAGSIEKSQQIAHHPIRRRSWIAGLFSRFLEIVRPCL